MELINIIYFRAFSIPVADIHAALVVTVYDEDSKHT